MKWKLIFSTLIILSALGLFYIWYVSPNGENVRKEFLEKNPTFEVVDLYVGEGNSDFATFHMSYKKPNDDTVYVQITTYQRCDDNKWRINCEEPKYAK